MNKLSYRCKFCSAILLMVIYNSVLIAQKIPNKNLTKEPNKETFRLRVNFGKKYINKRDIPLEIAFAVGAREFSSEIRSIFNSNKIETSPWLPLTKTKFSLHYDGPEGEIDIFVQLKDKAGNISTIKKEHFVLDETPPKLGKVVINKGADYSNNAAMRVKLNLVHDDAYKMQISNTKSFENMMWEHFVPNKYWVMGDIGEGERFVYVRFSDQAGNVSAISYSSIIFDHQHPIGTININKGQKYTNSRLVTLSLKSSDDTTIARVLSSNVVKNIPYQEDSQEKVMLKEWYLDSVQGLKVVKALFRDRAGNISEKVAIDDIYLDTKAPEISYFKINRGRKYFNNKDGKVNLYIGAKTIDIDFIMLISTDSVFKDATPLEFSGIVEDFKLQSETDGLKHVFLKFIDKAGNESTIAKASIFLDREVPHVKRFVINKDEKFTNTQKVTLHTTVEGVLAAQYSNNPNFTDSHWEKYSPLRTNWLLQLKDGESKIYARFRDRAGNITPIFSDAIIKDTVRPKGRISINGNAKYTNDKDKKVHLRFLYDKQAADMKVSTNPKFEGAEWESLKKELKGFVLPGDDGEKRCFVKYRDSAKNQSSIHVAKIILDRKSPTKLSININDDSLVTKRMDRIVKVNLYAEGATKVVLSETPDFKNKVVKKYMPITGYTLSNKEGKHTIYAKFSDIAGNVSEIISDSIILDRFPPKPIAFLIDGGNEWSNNKSKKVTLTMEVKGDLKFMAISSVNDKFEKPKWIPYVSEMSYTLPGDDGYKVIYVIFKDQYGHISKPLSASIKLKRAF